MSISIDCEKNIETNKTFVPPVVYSSKEAGRKQESEKTLFKKSEFPTVEDSDSEKEERNQDKKTKN